MPVRGSSSLTPVIRVRQTNGYRHLEENQRVEFEVTQGQKDPQAEMFRPF